MEGWDGRESVATPIPGGHRVRMKEKGQVGGKEKEGSGVRRRLKNRGEHALVG